MKAIVTGDKFPDQLYNDMLNRIKTERKVDQIRVAFLKAYLIRNKNIKELKMSFDENSENEAYVLGSVFAILEKMQFFASGGNLNSTITDRYFSKAITNPGKVFPHLFKLAKRHQQKYNNEPELMKCFMKYQEKSFPKKHDLDEQGSFIIGYYHQKNKPTKDKEIKNNVNTDPQ